MTSPTDIRTARVTLRLRDTAALGTPARADHRQLTHDHVPGSVLRGALAAAWLRTGLGIDAAFRSAFEGDGTFGPLHSAASLPIPLSISLHKRPPTAACNRWWWDAADPATTVPDSCSDCRSPLAASTGRPVGRPPVVARTRVALDRAGVAEDGQLYRRAALSRDTGELTGWVTGAAVPALTPGGNPVSHVRIGGELSLRGAAELTTTGEAPPPVEADGTRVVVRLVSPGVFVDRFGQPAETPHADLADALGVKIKSVRAWVRWTVVGGWHLASGLPKPQDRAVAAGSTYLVECAAPPSAAALARLAARGIGLRRREGCGVLGPRPAPAVAGHPLIDAVAPAVGWPGWTAHAARLRTHRDWPVGPGSAHHQAAADRSHTIETRAALQRLHRLTDPDLAHAVLEHLEVA